MAAPRQMQRAPRQEAPAEAPAEGEEGRMRLGGPVFAAAPVEVVPE